MKNLNILISLTFLLISQFAFTQEKYAVIINAYAPETKDTENSWQQANPSYEPYYEFWTDVYLMWEMLKERGFDNENIFVLYNNGEDYPEDNPEINVRYTAAHHYLNSIVDYRAYEEEADTVFTGLAGGIYGFPQVQEDDFFVLYTRAWGHIRYLFNAYSTCT